MITIIILVALWNCLRKAGLEERIASLAKGLDAEVEENGLNFSQGERQLLCLARVLMERPEEEESLGPPLLLCDEPTAACDLTTDRHIHDTLLHGSPQELLTRRDSEADVGTSAGFLAKMCRQQGVQTTHFMDEAETLGDRIAIMAAGKVKCVGSALFLKSQYGVGYTLTIAKSPQQSAEQSRALDLLIHSHCSRAELLSDVGAPAKRGDAMVDCGCCNDVAVSPNLQLFYGVVCILYVLSSLGEFLAAGMDGPDMMLACVTMSTLFVIMVLWILMLASRCCAPCCCREAVPDVPPTCPLGPCQTSNPKCLDYPFMIGMGGEVVTEGTRRVVLPACLYTNFIRGEWDFSPLQLCRLLWVTLLILGADPSSPKDPCSPCSLVLGDPCSPCSIVVGSPVAVKEGLESQP
eukprot:s2508_g2.t1